MLNRILSRPFHRVKVGDNLILYNKVFSYPPFRYFSWNVPVGTKVVERALSQNSQIEFPVRVEFKFLQTGVHDIRIERYSKNNIKETYNIKVVCER